MVASKPLTRHLKADTFWFGDGKLDYLTSSGNVGRAVFPTLTLSGTTGGVHSNWPWTGKNPGAGATPPVDFKGHGNYGCNFAFGDGHVAAVTQNEWELLTLSQRKRFVGYAF